MDAAATSVILSGIEEDHGAIEIEIDSLGSMGVNIVVRDKQKLDAVGINLDREKVSQLVAFLQAWIDRPH